MDGKWKWPLVLLLFITALPKIVWYKFFPPKPSPMEEHLYAQQKRALEQRRWDDIPVTAEEDEVWRELEKRL